MRPQERAAKRERPGGRHTAPQIFVSPLHVGGCDDLFERESLGQLDELLNSTI